MIVQTRPVPAETLARRRRGLEGRNPERAPQPHSPASHMRPRVGPAAASGLSREAGVAGFLQWSSRDSLFARYLHMFVFFR